MRVPALAVLALALAGLAAGAEADETVRAERAIDGDTLLLADGRELRLVGLRAPKPGPRGDQRDRALAADATRALGGLAAGKTLVLAVGGLERDRRGRVLAQATTESGQWLQGAMLALGLARVETFADNRARAREMLSIEAEARAQGRGLWGDARYRVLDAAEPDRIAEGFQLVEGKVERVTERRDRVYLDFGPDWRRDFTVSIARRDRATFRTGGLDLAALAGAVLRVRGWVRPFNGPMIETTHPEQIELIRR